MLQGARQGADYNPMIRLTKAAALNYVRLAEDGIKALREEKAKDKKAFAVWILIRGKGATDARQRVREGKVRQL